jgi:hypothetical protein
MLFETNTFTAKSAPEGENFRESHDVIRPAAMRAGAVTGLHSEDERGDLLFGEDDAAFVAFEANPVIVNHLAKATAAIGLKIAMWDEGQGHGFIFTHVLLLGDGSTGVTTVYASHSPECRRISNRMLRPGN